ncbi:rho GTPase-activating protein 1-like [Acomys russatus]|uniref:rho GTPase-activating protein 1-like n=1 Tax=Acomys russatus TaxID=60746 RepID=UPI0021E2FDCA|nr:rho GTPase-activating protein 1-like [Acomys russatus]
MDPLSELQDDLTLDDTSQALNQLKLASIDEKNWPSDEMPDFPKSDDSKSSSPEPVTHLKWDDPYYDIARHQIVEVAGKHAWCCTFSLMVCVPGFSATKKEQILCLASGLFL